MPCATTSGEAETLEDEKQVASGVPSLQAHNDENSETIRQTTATPEVKSKGDQDEKTEMVETHETEASKGTSEEEQVKKESEEKNKQDEKSSQEKKKETPQAKMKSELEDWSKRINDAIGAAGDGLEEYTT